MSGSAQIDARVVLLRHAESTWNEQQIVQGQLDDARLSAAGKSQASAVAETLRSHSFNWIVTSDLTRARETAAIVDDALGLEVAIAPALRERSFGVYEGRPFAQLPSSASGIHDGRVVDSSARPEGGESLDDLYERCAKFVDSLRAAGNERLLLVTHGGTIRAIRAYCQGLTMQDLEWEPVANCSIWPIDIGARVRPAR
jgi:probable phosphoglycerate mutase